MEEGKASKERRGNAGEVGTGVVSYRRIRRADSIEKGDHLVVMCLITVIHLKLT